MSSRVWLFVLSAYIALFARVTSDAYETLSTSHKVWWAKRLTSNLYSAGRLTESQIKYATEAGFKSIISLPDTQESASVGGENQPRTSVALDLIRILGGRFGESILAPGDMNWKNIATVTKFSEVMTRAPKPVLLYCNTVYSATFVALGYLANQTRLNISSPGEPVVNSDTFYQMAANLGLYYDTQGLRQLVSDLTGAAIVDTPPKPDVSNLEWYSFYWWAKPVYKNWYIAGQMWTNYIDHATEQDIKGFYKAVINVRSGMTTNGSDSQEEVTLLNIKDGTGTYAQGRRQSIPRLLATRIDPSKPNTYVSPASSINYATKNTNEFGDDIGYNEATESGKFQDIGIKYIHTSMAPFGYDASFFHGYISEWTNAGRDDVPVLIHCAGAKRATFAGLLIVGHQQKRHSTWAVQRGKELGYDFETDTAALNVFKEILGEPEPETSAGQSLSGQSLLGYMFIMLLNSILYYIN